MSRWIPALILSVGIAATGVAQASGPANLAGLLSAATPHAELAGTEYRLTAACWLNLMPPVPKTGAPLYALVTVEAASLPAGLSVGSVWIVSLDGGVQSASRVTSRDSGSPSKLQVVARFDQPPAGTEGMRVAIELRSGLDTNFLATDPVPVERVY